MSQRNIRKAGATDTFKGNLLVVLIYVLKENLITVFSLTPPKGIC